MIDTNIFYNFLFETKLTDKASKIFEIEEQLFTSFTVMNDHQDVTEIWKLMRKCKLLPNDALIAATCKHYGIKKIATFDGGFKRVGFLEIVEV